MTACALGSHWLATHYLGFTQADALDSQALAAINAYNPGLSGAWMLQRAMSLRVGQKQVAVLVAAAMHARSAQPSVPLCGHLTRDAHPG